MPPSGDPAQLFSQQPYYGGALVLYALRQQVGDATFQKIERAWVNRYRDESPSTADFIDLASQVSNQDLHAFLHAWLDDKDAAHAGPPRLDGDPPDRGPPRQRSPRRGTCASSRSASGQRLRTGGEEARCEPPRRTRSADVAPEATAATFLRHVEPRKVCDKRVLDVVPEEVVHPGLLGGWWVSRPSVPRRAPDEVAR